MRYSDQVLEDVRSGNDIVSVISEHVRLTQKGPRHIGLCPFHNEKTPSFSVSPDKQLYHCFGCGAGGNVITFVMEKERLGFVDAVKYLADRIHYVLPTEGNPEEAAQNARKRELVFEMNKAAARLFYRWLKKPEGAAAAAYLDTRGVLPETRKKYGLGYAPGKKALTAQLLSEFPKEALDWSGLVIPDKKGGFFDRFSDRLMFPILDQSGKITGFGGRVLGDGEPKYMNSPETPVFDKSRSFYSINFAKASKSREFILVEGYMDVISLCQAGFPQTVAALGTAFGHVHAAALKRLCDSVIVLFDSDKAGTQAALRAFPFLAKEGLGIKALQVADAKDPDEYIKKNGAAAFAELLKTAESRHAFQIRVLKSGFNMSDASERVKFASEAAKIISAMESPIERDALEKEISADTGISAGAIRAEAGKLKKADPPLKKLSMEAPKADGADAARRGLAYFAAADKEVCKAMQSMLKPEELGDNIYGKLLALIYERMGSNRSTSPSALVDEFEETSEKRAVTELFTKNASFDRMSDRNRALNEMLRMAKAAYLDARLEALGKELSQGDIGAEALDQYQDLTNKRRNIDKLYMLTSDG
jgi:DNA primase